ncbi:MAG: LamG domain-containing protein [Phycisphaerae bacterium]|nr:LamG domain-containing protein [Phycisphaerae bacterium]
MNRIVHATVSLSVLALVGHVSPADIVTDSLAVYYRADNVDGRGNPGSGSTTIISNLVGASHHAAVQSGVEFVENTGVAADSPFRYAFAFDGDDSSYSDAHYDYLDLGSLVFSGPATNATFEFWFKPEEYEQAYGQRMSLFGETAGNGDNRNYVYLHKTDGSVRFQFSPKTGGEVVSGSIVDYSEFAQLVVVKSGDDYDMYVNGQPEWSIDDSDLAPSGSPSFDKAFIGARSDNYGEYSSFHGQMSIVRIYNGKALSPADVLQNYKATLHPEIVTDGLALYYRADNVDGLGNPGSGSTATITNLIGDSHHAAVQSGVAFVTNSGEEADSPFRYAFAFDGDDSSYSDAHADYLDLGSTLFSGPATNATWEFWFKPEEYADAFGQRMSLFVESAGTANNRNFVYLHETDGTVRFQFSPLTGSEVVSDSIVDYAAFAQLVVVKSGDDYDMYIDGRPAWSMDDSTLAPSGSPSFNNAYIGARKDSYGVYSSFHGQMSIVRIYDGNALSPAEVLYNYKATVPPPRGTVISIR